MYYAGGPTAEEEYQNQREQPDRLPEAGPTGMPTEAAAAAALQTGPQGASESAVEVKDAPAPEAAARSSSAAEVCFPEICFLVNSLA